jgi:hypothetical protein
MSITINQQPQAFTPIYNESVFVLTSTNTGETNFKFVCDIYLEGGSTYIARVLLNTIPGTSNCVFDAHRIVENYLTSDIAQTTGFAKNTNSYIRFFVKFGEQYGSTPTVYVNLATSATKTAYNGIFDFLDWVGYNYSDWQLTKNAEKNCLSNAPLTQSIELDQSLSLYFAPSGANTAYQLEVTTYDSNDSIIDTYVIDNSFTAATNYHQRVGVGTRDLNAATLSTGTQPVIDASVSYYIVTIVDDSFHDVSKDYRFNISSGSKYTTKRLHFMNKPGGFDAFNFTAIHRRSENITRQSYRQNTGSLSSNAWSNDKQDRGTVIYDTTIDDSMHLISGYITEEESTWLEELFTSPEIYLESGTDLLPYVVTSSSYSVKEKEADKLINLEIDIAPAVQRRRQRG